MVTNFWLITCKVILKKLHIDTSYVDRKLFSITYKTSLKSKNTTKLFKWLNVFPENVSF